MSLGPVRAVPLTQRPSSSHSHRSVSRASQRPISRLSQRSKQPRLFGLLNTLVTQVTGLNVEYDNDDIQEAVDSAFKRIDNMKQAAIPDLTQIEVHIKGHMEKARINNQDIYADLIQTKYSELKLNVTQHKDWDTQLKFSTLPHHLQFLLLLSSPPSDVTFSSMEAILTRDNQPVPRSPPVTWRKILKEEPFEGQHWQGAFGLPEGSVVDIWNEDSSDSDALSLLGSPDFPEDTASSSEDERLRPHPQGTLPEQSQKRMNHHRARELVEKLQAKQYWKSGWHTDADLTRRFDIGDPSTLGPATSRMLLRGTASFADPEQEICINEIDAVREVLMALQGHQCCLFQIRSDQDVHSTTTLHNRRIVHFTRTSQASILAAFAEYISTLSPLREFVRQTHENATISSTSASASCRTFEAFSAAVNRQLFLFDEWCSEKEKHIGSSLYGGSSSNHVISLLGLEKEVGEKMAWKFHALLGITRSFETRRDKLSPSTLSTLILNALLDAVRNRFAIGDTSTAQSLLDVWRESAEPLWTNIGRWLKDGIPIRSGFEGETYSTEPTWGEREFFIRMNPLVDLGSPDFWESGYTLLPCHHNSTSRSTSGSGSTESGIPNFMQCIADDLLAAGKAIGLLRALNMIHLVGDDWPEGWLSFRQLTERLQLHALDEALEAIISDSLIPSCRRAQSCFLQVLVDECDLWKHVQSLEQVYLMTRGDAMSHFGEKLFTRMDTNQPWNDFHFLNSAFRNVAQYGSSSWINPSLVRISHRGPKDRNIKRTIRAIDGLYIEYAVPFPLTYLFGPDTNTGYSSVFSFLLQIKRTKGVLDRILIRGLSSSAIHYDTHGQKAFYVLRNKLSWFVNTLLNFIMTNVIHAGLIEFHEALREASSLDDMVLIHRSHLDRLLGRCLLQESTAALHRAILSILDIGLHFSDCLSAFAGDGSSFDVSRRSLLAMRHRHRRSGRSGYSHRPDVIGFTETLSISEDETESETDDETVEPSISADGIAISFVEEGFIARLQRMNTELDGLVRFVRHGVESLAGGLNGVRGEASATFGILAFSLEDWGL